MIDPKFKDMLNISRVPDPTPEQILDYIKMRSREEEMEQALKDGNAYMFGRTLRTNQPETNANLMPPGSKKMRNSVLFSNTFADPEPTTNATFIPPQPGSMYDPQNQRRKLATELDIAMTTDPRNTINPTMTPDIFARPSGSTLLNNVNANSAPVMFQNLNKEAVADNLEKTIGDVNKRENKIAKRKEAFNKLRMFGLALQGKDPNASNLNNFMKMLDLQYKTSLMQNMGLKNQDRASIIAFARSQAPNDASLSDSQLNAIMNNDAVALQYGNREAKGNEPEEVLNNYILTGTISPNAFNFLQQNLNKFADDAEGKIIKDILSKTNYDQYVQNDKIKQDFNSLLRRQSTTGNEDLNRYINGSFVTEIEADALNFARQSSFLQRVR